MDIINQTNRCILFEEINPEKPNLLTVVGDPKDMAGLKDEKIREINQHLLVRSFDEFLEKFSPRVYSYFNANNQRVAYTLKKPENLPEDCVSEIRLDQNNDFLKMLFTLVNAKRSQGIQNDDFKFEKVLDMISPKKIVEDIQQVRKEIRYLYDKYEELDDENPKKLDLADQLNDKFAEARQNYSNVLAMLPLAIEDIKTRLTLGSGQESQKTETIKIGMLTMGDDGELKIIEAPKNESKALVALDEQKSNSLVAVFENDYEEAAQKSSSPTSPYIKDLVVRTFCPSPALQTEINIEREVNNYNTYLDFYKSAKDDFVKTAKPLVEKILGVKMFFDQYDTKNKGMQPAIIVTNTKLDMIVKDNQIPRLKIYLNTVNGKNDFSNTLWFGIVPAVELKTRAKKAPTGPFPGRGSVSRERTITEDADGNTLESLTMLLQVLKDYRVQVFFNFQATEDTTFDSVLKDGIQRYIDRCTNLTRQDYSEFAIPCLPNFTIIPEDKSGMELAQKLEATEEGAKLKEEVIKLWIEGVYVDAAYIAAGLVAAYQCPEYLKGFYRNVSRDYPGVRFDIESGDNSLKVTTTMAQEITGFTDNIKLSINRKNFGFLFSSENAQLQGKKIKRITVYKARSLASAEDGFDCIYKTLVSTYIERMIRFHTLDFKQDKIISFFSSNPDSQKSQWFEKKNREFVNAIIQPGDDLNYAIEDNVCRIKLEFNGNVKNLEVEMTRSTSGSGTGKA